MSMTIDEALKFADEWTRGVTIYPGAQGWRVVCMLLADEVRRLRSNALAQGREPLCGEASPGATGSTTPGNHGERA